jgi:hypothetical protein
MTTRGPVKSTRRNAGDFENLFICSEFGPQSLAVYLIQPLQGEILQYVVKGIPCKLQCNLEK